MRVDGKVSNNFFLTKKGVKVAMTILHALVSHKLVYNEGVGWQQFQNIYLFLGLAAASCSLSV